MDDLQLLREMRSDIGSAPPATLARGRKKSWQDQFRLPP
jgi:hypothetical protein